MTVTQQLTHSAGSRGPRAALAAGPHWPGCSYGQLAALIGQAAAGLAWRGLRPRDVVGLYLPDASSYVLARHAVAAAGGVPCPVSGQLAVTEAAGQLADCGARMLLTAAPLAASALAMADRSWVRQVICFGDAPGTTPFGSLLSMGTLRAGPARQQDRALLPYSRGEGGALRPGAVTHLDLASRLAALAGPAGVSADDVVLASPPAGNGAAYTAVLDHALLAGARVVAASAGELAGAAARHHGTAAVVPLGGQVPDAGPLRLFAVA